MVHTSGSKRLRLGPFFFFGAGFFFGEGVVAAAFLEADAPALLAFASSMLFERSLTTSPPTLMVNHPEPFTSAILPVSPPCFEPVISTAAPTLNSDMLAQVARVCAKRDAASPLQPPRHRAGACRLLIFGTRPPRNAGKETPGALASSLWGWRGPEVAARLLRGVVRERFRGGPRGVAAARCAPSDSASRPRGRKSPSCPIWVPAARPGRTAR